jgi:hypothetical protein
MARRQKSGRPTSGERRPVARELRRRIRQVIEFSEKGGFRVVTLALQLALYAVDVDQKERG